jgi:protein-disulfide isomerase
MATHARVKALVLGALMLSASLVIAAPRAVSAGTQASVSARSALDSTATEHASITSLLRGIPENGNVLGKPTAPVTLVWFGDLECPICRAFVLGALPSVIRRWVRSGDLRIVYASLETATREPETFLEQQVAAYAAGAQHKAWYYIEIFYHEQGEEDTGYVTERYLDGIARQVPGLNFARWARARKLSKYPAQIEGDAQAAYKLGLTGTPSFQIGHTGGPLKRLEVESLIAPQSFNAAIEGVLAG